MMETQMNECMDLLRWYFDGAKDVGAYWPYSANRTAYQEAGQVIALLSLGLKFESVTIESEHRNVQGTVGFYQDGHINRGGSPDGYTSSAGERSDDVSKLYIIISAAGSSAARRWNRPLSLLQYLRSQTDEGIDRQSVDPASANDVGFRRTAAQPLREECRTAAADILDARWGDIELVADALVRNKTLTYDEVVSLLAADRQRG